MSLNNYVTTTSIGILLMCMILCFNINKTLKDVLNLHLNEMKIQSRKTQKHMFDIQSMTTTLNQTEKFQNITITNHKTIECTSKS